MELGVVATIETVGVGQLGAEQEAALASADRKKTQAAASQKALCLFIATALPYLDLPNGSGVVKDFADQQ